MANAPELDPMNLDAAVMARLRAPFGCEFIEATHRPGTGRWRIHDANDDALASVAPAEEGYARLIVQALNEHFARRTTEALVGASPAPPLRPRTDDGQ